MTARVPRRLAIFVAVAIALVGLPGARASSYVGPGYFATDNVEWLANIPLHTSTSGARILGKTMYVTDNRGLSIYDISNPELPLLRGFGALPQTWFVEEDVETNGRIALVGTVGTNGNGANGRLFVFDVRDPSRPTLLNGLGLPGGDNHTVTCALDCTWAYGAEGAIVDLRDPANPKLAGNWRQSAGLPYAHDLTEVTPGRLVTASNPLFLIDVNADPLKPRVVTLGVMPDRRFVHTVEWPRAGADRFLLVGGETFGDCAGNSSGAFMTFHAGTSGFSFADEHRVEMGLPNEGKAQWDLFCAHWFKPHPRFADGGLVAMGWYEHGTRFLDVAPRTGQITEKGWFIPAGGETSAAYWVTDDILYALDYNRGIDVLRFTNRPVSGTRSVPQSPGWVEPPAGTIRYDGPAVADRFACPIPY